MPTNTPMRKAYHISLAGFAAILSITGSFLAGATVVALAPTEPPRFSGVALAPGALTAKAAVVYDIRDGKVIYQKNANAELPLASLTKLMAAEVVLSAKDESDVVQITPQSLATEGDSGLRPGSAHRLGDLLRLALVASSNDAIAAAAESLGDDYLLHMNAAAQKLGLTKTRFLNPTGLDVDAQTSGAYGSAYDVARLAATFFNDHPTLFEETVRAEVSVPQSGGDLVAAATATPLLNVPGLIGGKTGYTDLAGGNMVVAFDIEPGRPGVAVVLGSTRDGRFVDVRALIEATRKAN